jgi:hypothetical protein
MQQLGFTAMQRLRYAAGFVGFSSFALASSLFVIQAPSMLLGVSLNVLVLRHRRLYFVWSRQELSRKSANFAL